MSEITEQQNLTTCRTVINEIFDGKNFTFPKLEQCYCCHEFSSQDPAHSERSANFSNLLPVLDYYENAFPGYKAKEIDMVAKGDLVFIHWQISGTHRGEFLGHAATEKDFKIEAMSKCKLKDGKIVSVVQIHDTFGLMQQLGLDGRNAEQPSRVLGDIRTKNL